VRFKMVLSAGTLALAALLLTALPRVAAIAADPPISGTMIKFVASDPPVPVPETPFISADGETIKLADLKGRFVLLNFWATWCAPCIRELPSIEALSQAVTDPRFEVMLVSIDRGGAKVHQPFLQKLGITTLSSASDPSAKLLRALKSPGVPVTLLIGPDGMIQGRLIGDAEWDSEPARALIHHYLGAG